LAGLAVWVHIVCVPRSAIYRSIPDALAGMGFDPNIVWVTGPSKTADIEGILIEGVHGPGVQVCWPV
jgi:L-lactate dehydrogenase complex protein LldG